MYLSHVRLCDFPSLPSIVSVPTASGSSFPTRGIRILGFITVAFFVHSIPTVLLILYLKVYRHAKIFAKASVPAYVFAVGLMGLSIVSISSYVTARIGAVASGCISNVVKMISAAVIDHFGFFGVDRRPFRWKELPCYLLAVAGTVLIVTG